MSSKEKIVARIHSFPSDYVFIADDFFDITGYETARSILNRLVNEGQIKRIMKELYYNPGFIELINEYGAPSADQVAKALARKYNWTIAPSGNSSLNALGLSTQVLAKWSYVSDGRYANFTFGNITLEFKHCNNKDISKMSTLSAMVIQAIKAIGKAHMTHDQIDYLKRKLSSSEKEKLLVETKATSAWVYRYIKEICED